MPRQAKPYLRKQTKSWYSSIRGKQLCLGKTREAAFARFRELIAEPEQVQNAAVTLYELSQLYLDWCEANRKLSTYERHRYFLKSFLESVGKRLRPSQLKRHHVRTWHESLEVGSTTQNDAVTIVQRMLNWSAEPEYITRNPIAGMKKPRRARRDVSSLRKTCPLTLHK